MRCISTLLCSENVIFISDLDLDQIKLREDDLNWRRCGGE